MPPFLFAIAAGSLASVQLMALAPVAAAAYLCLLAPGQAWWSGRRSALPRLFARVAVSAAWTSGAGLALAAAGSFSLPRMVVLSGAFSLAGYLAVARVRKDPAGDTPHGPGMGALACALALALYWPAYETHFASSDSAAYSAAGVHLARHRSLTSQDPVLGEISPMLRRFLFQSVLGDQWKPPYSRMPGGLVIDSPDSDQVRMAFFPLPAVWAGLFADSLGARHSGGYAPWFAALALWATYLFARRRMGLAPALATTALVALNGANYWSGRFPLSEPLVWFFLWAALAAMDAYEEEGFTADAALAGLMLGMAALARLETALFILAALAARSLAGPSFGVRRLGGAFSLPLAALLAATALETGLLAGAYTAPLSEATVWLWIKSRMALNQYPLATAIAVTAVVAFGCRACRRMGMKRALLALGLGSLAAAYAVVFSPVPDRTLGWLGAYLGWPALALAAAGLGWTWQARQGRGRDCFFLLLTLVVSGLLIYNPRVLPAMPWASRRFVPMVIPALVVLASMACLHIGRRRRLAGLLVFALLAASVLAPARYLWARPYYQGTYRQLAELHARLPEKDAILLIDSRLDRFVLSTPLWLAYERNSLPVYASTRRGRYTIAALVRRLGAKHSLYLLKPTLSPAEPIAGVKETQTDDFTLQVLLPEPSSAAPPRLGHLYTMAVSVFRLDSRSQPAP